MSDTVLFVDDEENILNSINRLFADRDMRIRLTTYAEEALDIVTQEDIAVIVSDYQMPGMKGVDLLTRVKNISPHTLKIIMTAHADLNVAVDAINRGEVFRFITKPWDDTYLVQTVEEAINRYLVIQTIRKGDEPTLRSLARTIELKDPYTYGHSDRVSHYSHLIAEELNLDERIIKSIKYGGILHDCGKIGVPDRILNKKGKLTESEYEIVKNHPRWGAEIALQAELPAETVNIIRYHHEHYDGDGYPSRLTGRNIPLEARIVTIADVYDALTSDRCYRVRYSMDKALEIMQMMKGIVFDPELLEIFLVRCLTGQHAV